MDDRYDMLLDEFEDDDYDDGEEYDEEYEEEYEDDDLDDFDDFGDFGDDVVLAEVLREALADDYAEALPEQLDEALEHIFDSMSPAEAFNFGKALNEIGKGASQVLADPTVGQIAKAALPVAGGAVGTLAGGPGAGTVIGTSLGAAAAKALPTPPTKRPPKAAAPAAPRPPAPAGPGAPVAAATPAPAAAAALPAAAQGLLLTQQPRVLQCLLAAALGDKGTKQVNGLPVAPVMNMLSSVFQRAAEDADELLDAAEATAGAWADPETYPAGDVGGPHVRAGALYDSLLESEPW